MQRIGARPLVAHNGWLVEYFPQAQDNFAIHRAQARQGRIEFPSQAARFLVGDEDVRPEVYRRAFDDGAAHRERFAEIDMIGE